MNTIMEARSTQAHGISMEEMRSVTAYQNARLEQDAFSPMQQGIGQ
jgi:hypothetical protein